MELHKLFHEVFISVLSTVLTTEHHRHTIIKTGITSYERPMQSMFFYTFYG